MVVGTHLVVHIQYVDVARGSATAISYTWGEYFRRVVTIGHNQEGSLVKMELGEDWKIEAFITTLDEICAEYKFCWIDQLCINQSDDDNIRLILARIPDIYRSFNVLVLIPGKPCSCHAEQMKRFRGGEAIEVDYAGCPSHLSYGAWFSRLWPRQELLYARMIKTKWTEPGQVQCSRQIIHKIVHEEDYTIDSADLEELIEKLPHIVHLYHKEKTDKEKGDIDVMPLSEVSIEIIRKSFQALLVDATRTRFAAIFWVSQWAYSHQRDRKRDSAELVLRFLLGVELESDHIDQVTYTLERRMNDFMFQLGLLQHTKRSATQDRDYVVAVWVDCPGYEVPVDYKKMSLAALLENALHQLKETHGLSIPSTVPAGLFEAHTATGVWKPSLYLDSIIVQSTMDVYGTSLEASKGIATSTGIVPLNYLPKRNQTPASCIIHDYKQLFGDATPEDAFEFLVTVAETWDSSTLGDIFRFYTINLDPRNSHLLRLFGIMRNMSGRAIGDTDEPTSSCANWARTSLMDTDGDLMWLREAELDHVEVVLDYVSSGLGLRPENARALNLRVMVDLGNNGLPPRLGLIRPDLTAGVSGRTVTICHGCPHQKDYVRRGLYEALEVGDGMLQVFAVWMTPRGIPSVGIGGFVCPHEPNGYFV